MTNGRLTGTVTDESLKGVEAVTVSLLHAKDSSLSKISVTDTKGNYSFENLALGRYLIQITAVGHSRFYSEVFELNEGNRQLSLKTISLKSEAKDLKAVAVVARKPLIE